jgi:hypothetical protein
MPKLNVDIKKIRGWVYKKVGRADFAEDIVNHIAMRMVEGNNSPWHWLYCEYVKKNYKGGTHLELIESDLKDNQAVNEDIIIMRLDLERKLKNNASLENVWKNVLPVGEKLRTVEYEFIYQTLMEYSWNRTNSAEVLGISLRGIRIKIGEMKALGYFIPENISRK